MRQVDEIMNNISSIREGIVKLSIKWTSEKLKDAEDRVLEFEMLDFFQANNLSDVTFSFQVAYEVLRDMMIGYGGSSYDLDTFMDETKISFGDKTPREAFLKITLEMVKKIGKISRYGL